MRANQKNSRRSTASRRGVLAMLPFAATLVAGGAHAQSSGCDQFRATLAARIDPSIRGFTLDIVPSAAAVPSGAKVFGTCDGGAYKILFRRGGNTRPAPADASVAASAPAPSPVTKLPVEPPRPAPAPPPTAPAPAPVVHAVEAAPAVTTTTRVAEALGAAARDTEVMAVAGSAPTQAEDGDAAKSSPGPQAAGFMTENWHWLLALLLVPGAVWLWFWHAHRTAYDEAGLPRGPKIRV